MQTVESEDEFEIYRAQSYSGGFILGNEHIKYGVKKTCKSCVSDVHIAPHTVSPLINGPPRRKSCPKNWISHLKYDDYFLGGTPPKNYGAQDIGLTSETYDKISDDVFHMCKISVQKEGARARISSLPTEEQLRKSYRKSRNSIRRVRSFTITKHGLRKEYLREGTARSFSCDSDHEALYHPSQNQSPSLNVYRVRILGGENVGKSTLIRCLATENEFFTSIVTVVCGLTRKMQTVDSEDEFEIYRAQSYSGGFVLSDEHIKYGVTEKTSKSRASDAHIASHISPLISGPPRRKSCPKNWISHLRYGDYFLGGTPPKMDGDHNKGLKSETDDDISDDVFHMCKISAWKEGTRARISSLPTEEQLRNNYRESRKSIRRVRSFTITKHGLRKEYLRESTVRSFRCDSDQEALYHPSQNQSPSPNTYRVRILGGENVGKSTLIRCLATENEVFTSIDDEPEKCVSILLDGEESTLKFIDLSHTMMTDEANERDVDAYVVVYSVEDRRSFEAAINQLYQIREREGRYVALILVANKTDLVRTRLVPEEEGRAAANTYESKYIEVSAAIDLKTDELLVGVLKQIRLFKQKLDKTRRHRRGGNETTTAIEGCCMLQIQENALARIFKAHQATSRSCDNLYVL